MKKIWIPLGIILLVATVLQVRAMHRGEQVQPRLAATPAPVDLVAEGQVVTYPGAQVTVGSDTGGTLATLEVQEKDSVRKGAVLATIKADDLRAALLQAKANVAESDADIRLDESELERAKHLWDDAVGPKQAFDKAARDLEAARAHRASAAAEVGRLEAVLEKTVIRAPIDGVVISRVAQQGETIAAGAPIVTIADLRHIRVEAEIDEFDASRVALGKPALISAEGYDGSRWKGVIEEVPDSVTSRRLKPQDPSKPIDTRVLLVKIALSEPTPLKLGQRVDVRIGR